MFSSIAVGALYAIGDETHGHEDRVNVKRVAIIDLDVRHSKYSLLDNDY